MNSSMRVRCVGGEVVVTSLVKYVHGPPYSILSSKKHARVKRRRDMG